MKEPHANSLSTVVAAGASRPVMISCSSSASALRCFSGHVFWRSVVISCWQGRGWYLRRGSCNCFSRARNSFALPAGRALSVAAWSRSSCDNNVAARAWRRLRSWCRKGSSHWSSLLSPRRKAPSNSPAAVCSPVAPRWPAALLRLCTRRRAASVWPAASSAANWCSVAAKSVWNSWRSSW